MKNMKTEPSEKTIIYRTPGDPIEITDEMLENAEILQRIVKESGAHSTDLQSKETPEHLCSKCVHYAEEWAPVADKLWAEDKAAKEAKKAARAKCHH